MSIHKPEQLDVSVASKALLGPAAPPCSASAEAGAAHGLLHLPTPSILLRSEARLKRIRIRGTAAWNGQQVRGNVAYCEC